MSPCPVQWPTSTICSSDRSLHLVMVMVIVMIMVMVIDMVTITFTVMVMVIVIVKFTMTVTAPFHGDWLVNLDTGKTERAAFLPHCLQGGLESLT